MQKLLFPFRRGIIIAGYMTSIYRKEWGYDHWGIDISSYQGYTAGEAQKNNHMIFASGDGEVVWCKYDTPTSSKAKTLGMAIAIRYNDCIAHDGTVKDVVLRYMHCDTTFVKVGDRVEAGQPISVENKIGTNGYHVHVEVDMDVNNPQWTPQVSQGHSGWLLPDKKYWRTDITVNPSLWLWQNDEFVQDPFPEETWNDAWINDVDRALPLVNEPDTWEKDQKIAELEQRIKELEAENAELKDAKKKLQQILELIKKWE